ncbi:MAG: phosphate signaling complex protein PhoU [Eubacteriales bacterium]|nr:phosphate signaling complex protein PhoU [Eubacteriales bacterium]
MATRTAFEEELRVLKNLVLTMSSQVLQNYRDLFTAIRQQDEETIHRLIENDTSTNNMERQIESKCLSLITKQQPVARDLRTISASLKVCTDMERIGHHVTDIAELSGRLRGIPIEEYSAHLGTMAEKTGEMLASAIAAFTMRHPTDAQRVIDSDDEIDEAFNRVKEELVLRLRESARGTESVEQTAGMDISAADVCVDLLMVAKYLEKIGDHAVNIGEWEIFQETGDIAQIRLL